MRVKISGIRVKCLELRDEGKDFRDKGEMLTGQNLVFRVWG